MKYFYLILVFVTWGCMAQSVVLPLYKFDDEQDGVYYKDIFNDFDKFVGTWKYTNEATSLTIILQKQPKQLVYDDGISYEIDYMIGGYKYVENGVEKINTLSQLSQDLPRVVEYNIFGSTIAGPTSIYCVECGINDRTLVLSFMDPNRDIPLMEPEMLFKRVDSSGVEKLELNFRAVSAPPEDIDSPRPQFSTYTVPFGKYVLTKVN